MDTTFIIDSSDCDDRSNWNRLLYFVQTLVTYFNVSPSGGRIALIQFSNDASVVLKFNTLTGSRLNGWEVNKRVGLLQCQSGFRRIDKALDLADLDVLTSDGGVRNISRVSWLDMYSSIKQVQLMEIKIVSVNIEHSFSGLDLPRIWDHAGKIITCLKLFMI